MSAAESQFATDFSAAVQPNRHQQRAEHYTQQLFVPQSSLQPYAEPHQWYCYVQPSVQAREPFAAVGMPFAMGAPSTPPHDLSGSEDERVAALTPRGKFQKSFRMFGDSYPLQTLNF